MSASCTAAGGSVTFTANVTGEVTAYAWDFDDGLLVSQAGASATATFDGQGKDSYIVFVKAFGPGGTSDPADTKIFVPCL